MRAASVLGGSILLMLAAASPAGAEVIQGDCVGFVRFSNGAEITQSTPLSEVVEVPPEDTVVYFGDTTLGMPSEPETFSGSVKLALPLGGSWVIADWPNPPGETEEVSDEGTYTYEVPGFVPVGTGAFELTGTHTQRGQTCIVAVSVAVEGSPGPMAILGAAGTAVFGAGVIGAGFKRKVL
jgi:hypothetical protein